MIARAGIGELADRAVELTLQGPVRLDDGGFRPYERFEITLADAGEAPLEQTRDILRVGPVVAALAYDPACACFVLIRQFRVTAHLARGAGEIVELAAGLVEPGEAAEPAIRRECREEIGVAPRALLPMLTFMPSPGVTDEQASLFLALVDSRQVPAQAGEPGENELTRPFLVPVADALAQLTAPFPGAIGNSFVLVALQWFALNRERIDAFVAAQG
ncbi:ADP-ribose pyrophosphatase [Angulomicrobium tetraedrale]|uniref:GDP-mannose pyrophosphatase n=1 Tax=Ancylobacter tetraedralis TaxID=217068 RepID=A0A839ZFR7_9HYPH|nr:NUDIX hydrolase [Ancylobacter tetraedralis]MBB3773614.1 ADP-ribose pyrophosphatase [Ancylobacter tetraedralis]